MSNIATPGLTRNLLSGKTGNTLRRCAASQWSKHKEAIKVDVQREIKANKDKYQVEQEKMYLEQIDREQTDIIQKDVERCKQARELLGVTI